MTSLLLDTHTWVWALTGDPALSTKAAALITRAERVFISPISLFEIGQKVRTGKWPEMVPYIDDLPRLVTERGGDFASLSPEICRLAGVFSWSNRDPFDRMLAATAMINGLSFVSADAAFDSLADMPDWIARLW